MSRIVLISLIFLGCGGGLPTTLATLEAPGCAGPITLAEIEAADEASPGLQCLLLRAREAENLKETAAFARLCALLADRQPAGDRQDQLAAEGVRAAEAALAAHPDDGPAHYLWAVNLGIAVQNHMGQAIKSLKPLENHLTRAVKLSPSTDEGGPLRVLGLFYLRTPSWPDGPGDGDKALELLARAVAEAPSHPLNHLAHAQALWEVEEDAAAATRALDAAQAALKARDRGPVGQRHARDIAALRTEIGR